MTARLVLTAALTAAAFIFADAAVPFAAAFGGATAYAKDEGGGRRAIIDGIGAAAERSSEPAGQGKRVVDRVSADGDNAQDGAAAILEVLAAAGPPKGPAGAIASAEQTLSAAKTSLDDATALRDAALKELRAAHADVDPAALQDTRNALANDLLSDDQGEIDEIDAEIAAIDKALAAEARLATAENALDDAIAGLADARSDGDEASPVTDGALAAAVSGMPIAADATNLDQEHPQDGILDHYRSMTMSPSSTP